MKFFRFIFLSFLIISQETTVAQQCSGYTCFLDADFAAAIINDHPTVTVCSTDNTCILTTDINSITTLDVSGSDITSLSGIAEFTSLINLDASDNSISKVNLTSNSSLQYLNLNDNSLLGDLDLSGSTDWVEIRCANNSGLTSITFDSSDVNLSDNCTLLNFNNCSVNTVNNIETLTGLTNFSGQNNDLDTFDPRNHRDLEKLYINNNDIVEFSFTSTNLSLKIIWCHSNNLTSLDVSALSSLEELKCFKNSNCTTLLLNDAIEHVYCQENSISSINLSGLSDLEDLNCAENPVSSLGLSSCTDLTYLKANGTDLTILDVSNNQALGYLNIKSTDVDCVKCHPSQLVNGEPDLTTLDWHYPDSPEPNWTTSTCAASRHGVFPEFGNDQVKMIYPNPATSYIYLSEDFSGRKLEIYSFQGVLIHSTFLLTDKIDVSTLDPGMYIVKIDEVLEKVIIGK